MSTSILVFKNLRYRVSMYKEREVDFVLLQNVPFILWREVKNIFSVYF
jgi:hypothetical protein